MEKRWETGPTPVKQTISPEPLHTIHRECERSSNLTRPIKFPWIQQRSPDETQYDDRTEAFWSPNMSQFSLPSLLKS